MRPKASLHLSVAAIGAALLLIVPAARLAAQQTAPAGVTVGDKRSRRRGHRPERARSRRLGDRGDDRPAHQIRQDRRDRRSGPLRAARPAEGQLQRLGARLRPGRFAEGRRATPGKIAQSHSGAGAERGRGGANIIRRSTGIRCSRSPTRASSPALGRNGNGMPANMKSQAQWLDVVKTDGCIHLPSARQQGDAHDPEGIRPFRIPAEAWERRIQSGQAMAQMVNDDRPARPAARAQDCSRDWTDRIADGELPSPQPTRPQGVERNIVVTVWDWSRPRPICTTRSRPTSAIRRSMPTA